MPGTDGGVAVIILQGILAGLVGGILMAAVSEAFYRLGTFKSSILIIDGSFVTRFMKRRADTINTYLFGIPVHLLTSSTFWVVYITGTYILKWNPPVSMDSLSLRFRSLDFYAIRGTPCSRAGIAGKKRKPIRLG